MSSSPAPKKSTRSTKTTPRKKASKAESTEGIETSNVAEENADALAPEEPKSTLPPDSEYAGSLRSKLVLSKTPLPASLLSEGVASKPEPVVEPIYGETASIPEEIVVAQEAEISVPETVSPEPEPAPSIVAAASTAPAVQAPKWTLDRKKIWILGGAAAFVILSVITINAFQKQRKANEAMRQELRMRAERDLVQLAAMADQTSKLGESTNTKGLEIQVSQGLLALPEDFITDPRIQTHLQLAQLAARRADVAMALSQARVARDLGVVRGNPVSSANAELMIVRTLVQSGVAAQVEQLSQVDSFISQVAPGPERSKLDAQRLALQAEIASQKAVQLTEDDELRRALALAELKAESKIQLDQFSAKKNAEFQRREQLQQEAFVANDPAKMAQATQGKADADVASNAEWEKINAALREKTTTLMKPNADISAAQSAATEAWKQALTSATATADLELAAHCQYGLAESLLLQQNFPEAQAVVDAGLKDAAAPWYVQSNLIWLQAQIRAHLVQPGAPETAKSSLEAAQKAVENFERQAYRNPTTASRLAQAKALVAKAEGLLGVKEAPAHAEAAAKEQLEAAKDGGWGEVFHHVSQQIATDRSAVVTAYNPATLADLNQTRELAQVLREWYGKSLSLAPKKELSRSAILARELVSRAPQRFPWAGLLDNVE